MTETKEVSVSDREKDKWILTLNVGDTIEPINKNINCEYRRDIFEFSSGSSTLFSTRFYDTISGLKVVLPIFAKKNFNIMWTDDWCVVFKDTIVKPLVQYDYSGNNLYHIGNSRLLAGAGDVRTYLQGEWLCISLDKKSRWLLWWVEWKEIFLKIFQWRDYGNGYRSMVYNNTRYTTLPWTRISQLNRWSLEFYIINEWIIDKVVVERPKAETNNPIKYKVEKSISFEQFGEIQQIESDQNENFVLIVWKKDDKFSLYVLKKNDWEWGEAIATIPWIKEFVVMPDSALLGVLEDWTVKKIATTFSQFQKWYFENWWEVVMREDAVKVVKNNSHEKMLEAMDSVKLEWWKLWTESDDLEVSEQDVIEKFWSKKVEWKNKTIKELFDEAQTQKDIQDVESLAKKLLVSISSFSWWIKIKNHIRDIIVRKKEEIIIRDFEKDVNEAENMLNNVSNLQDLLNTKSFIMNLHERKKDIRWGTLSMVLWKKIREMVKSVDEKIALYQAEWKDGILQQIQKNTEELKSYIDSVSYGADLLQIYNLDIRKKTMELIEILDENEKKRQRNELLSFVSQRSSEILKEEKEESEKKESEILERRREIDDEINILIDILETIHSVEAVNEMRETDALAKKIESEIASIPPATRWEIEIKYNKAFKDRIFHIRRENIKWKGISQNLDDSWIDTMLYYVDTEKKDVSWKLKGHPTSKWMIKLEISLDDWKRIYSWDDFFENSDKFADVLLGNDISFEITQAEYLKLNRELDWWQKYGKIKLNKLISKLSSEKDETEKEEIIKEILDLKSDYKKARYVEKIVNRLIKKEWLNPRSYVPEVDHNFVVLDEEKESFKEISWMLLSQKRRSGITVLKGWPGLWKTVMCEYLAAVTNREIVRVQCSKKISYSEFFFAPTLKKDETSSSPAEWIKMMQKPWTIILFDEVDKLNADCLAWLHALFDGWRHIHDTQLWDFFADPDCIFMGTMNAYDPLPKAIASRSTFKEITYPSEENEAYKISKYFDNDFLNGLTFEEFKDLWNEQIKNWNKPKTKGAKDHKLYEMLDNIKKLLDVFKILRKKYEDEYERFEYELSYRDAAQIFDSYAVTNNFKKSLLDGLVNKADSVVWVEEKKEQRDMVKQAVKQVFWW